MYLTYTDVRDATLRCNKRSSLETIAFSVPTVFKRDDPLSRAENAQVLV